MNLSSRITKLERIRLLNADAFAHLSDEELTARIDELDSKVMAGAGLTQAQLARLRIETSRNLTLLEPEALATLVESIKQESVANA